MKLDRETRSVVIVLLVALSALTAGWTIRGSAIDPVRRVESGGVAASVPADWLVSSGSGAAAITARSLDPAWERVQVGLVPYDDVDSLEEIATKLSAAQARIVDGYRVLGEGAVVVAERPAHAVSYAYLTSDEGLLPVVVEGQAYYVRFDGHVVVAAMEADTSVFPDALDRFDALMRTVEMTEDAQ